MKRSHIITIAVLLGSMLIGSMAEACHHGRGRGNRRLGGNDGRIVTPFR